MESSQKLDNSRRHRNNLTNGLSSSSLSSASVSVESGSAEWPPVSMGSYPTPTTLSPVEGADDEELKTRENFLNNCGDDDLHKDYKKRRPLTVLKSHNVQCLPNSYSSSSTSETSLSLAPNSPFIPTDHLSRDVKQLNGYKYGAVSAKSDAKKTPGSTGPRGLLQMHADLGKQDTLSHSEMSDTGIAPKGMSKQVENRKHSKRKTGCSSAVSSGADAQTVRVKTTPVTKEPPPVTKEPPTVTKEPPPVVLRTKRLSEAETTDHQQHASNASSTLSVSSRRSKKQNKTKDAACCKISQHIDSPSHEHSKLPDNYSSPDLGNVKNKMSAKTLQRSVEGQTSTKEKDEKLDFAKKKVVWPGGYASTSGVAELDTFEVTSIRNQKLAAKQRLPPDKCIIGHIKVSSSNQVNALDTFDDDPVAPSVACRSVDVSLSLHQKHRDHVAAEKWIHVNRKVKRVLVPSNVVSHILGSNGSKLEAICQVTRAHIELETSNDPSETIFVLRGTLEQMQAASNMISALMKDSPKSSADSAKSGNVAQASGSTLHLTPQPSKELKTPLTPGQSSMQSVANDVVLETSAPQLPQVNGLGPNDEDYPDSIQSSASERSNPCSERCSPAQDLLIGEYSLFEHGLGQPLEKLLARNDSSKQTFARAAAIRMPSRTLTPIITNQRSAIDQLLLAKAPGYRNAKAMYGRDAYCAKTADLGNYIGPTGRYGCWPLAISGRGLERTKENDPSRCTTSQLFSSSNAHIPPLERPLSAPGFPSAHSSSSSSAFPGTHDRCVAPSDHLLTVVQTGFSNLNPNAPDFVFTLPLEEASANRTNGGMLFLEPCAASHAILSPGDSSADDSGCLSTDGRSAGEFSCSLSRLGCTFESVDVSNSSPDGSIVRDGGGFALPGSAVDDGGAAYVPPVVGDNAQWICSPEPWHPLKLSYGGMGRGGELMLPGTTAIASFPSRGELYRNYFAHPPFSPITSSPYNCAFYQQQNVMLAPPVQSWSHTTVAQAGP